MASTSHIAIQEYFGDKYSKVAQFGEMLVELGIPRGFIGPKEATRIWERHLVNCAGVCEVLPTQGAILDLGSGAGLPGIVIAIMRPNQQVYLLDSLLRRTNWLTEIADTLKLPNVTVIRGRAGEKLDVPKVQSVTARAVAPLEKLMGWSAPLLTKNGKLYALKGDTAQDEINAVAHDKNFKKFVQGWAWPPEISDIPTVSDIPDTIVVKLARESQ